MGLFRFLHLADVHLETHFGGRRSTRDRLRRATLEAFRTAVDFAIDQELHAILVAGDLYDDRLLSLRTELELVRQVRRLTDAGVWFLYACGNHDPGDPRYRAAHLGLDAIGAGERVRVFREAEPEQVTIHNRGGRPVAVVVGAGHAGEREGANLAARFPRVENELPVVGLLHTHVASAREAAAHDRYAPSTPADFARLDYSYWALGHIHVRQRAVEGLPVHYAGNLQGRNPRETGEKGGLRVEARAGAPAEPKFQRFAPVRWERIRVAELPSTRAIAELAEHVSRCVDEHMTRGEQLIACVDLVGETPLTPALRLAEEREALGRELAARTGALEVQVFDAGLCRPVDRAALRAAPTVLADALTLAERARTDDALLHRIAPEALAGAPSDELAYLRSLLADLPEELVERSLRRDEA